MGSGSLSELIAQIKDAVRRVLKAVLALAGTLGPKAAVKPPAHLGDHERLEESKYYPPALPYALKQEEEELPDSYGKTRLVLLVVDPNLVHAYWEVTPDKLREAERQAGNSRQAVLRFYEAGESFDVEVDLGARNWYVPLWSAGKSYYVELGLKSLEGEFAPLARSWVVQTPRDRPVTEVKERFALVSGPDLRPQIIPPPVYRKPARLREPAPSAVAALPRPADASEVLAEKLAELYAFREWRGEPLKPEEAPAGVRGGPGPEERYGDLAEMAEKQQTMGLSSALLQRHGQEH